MGKSPGKSCQLLRKHTIGRRLYCRSKLDGPPIASLQTWESGLMTTPMLIVHSSRSVIPKVQLINDYKLLRCF